MVKDFRNWLETLPLEAKLRELEIGERNIARINNFLRG